MGIISLNNYNNSGQLTGIYIGGTDIDLHKVLVTGDTLDTSVDASKAPISSSWAYNHENAADPHSLYLLIANIDDIPVDAEVAAPISSNWAYDHEIAADPHIGYQLESEKSAINGYASLDAGGKVPTGELPDAILGSVSYQGTWDATTNTPTLTSSVGTQGYYYVVSVAGATNLDGITDWEINDWAIYNGTAWEKVDNTETVISVAGKVGVVTLDTDDVTEATNLYYTEVRVDARVTYETLASNGDVGSAAAQLAIGNHTHAGVYEPVDATILRTTDVHDTPVDASTDIPISSNWAYDHENAVIPHAAEAWTDVASFSNSWVNEGTTHQTRYKVLPTGLVLLEGHITTGTVATDTTGIAFQLPANYRPNKELTFVVNSASNTFTEVRVLTTGDVKVYSSANTTNAQTYTSLANISFYADQ